MRATAAMLATALSACAANESSAIIAATSGLSARPNAPSCNATTFANPPAAWSKSGCANASDPRFVDSGLLFYDVNVPSWLDGLTAARYLSIPAGATISVNADNSLTYPTGTVIVQMLSDSQRLIETRVLSLTTSWSALSYAWSDKDAALVDTSGTTKTIDGLDYLFAPRAACLSCHNAQAGVTIGSTIGQLNRPIVYFTSRLANQLDTFAAIGLLDGTALPVTRPQFSGPFSTASFTERARSYLDASCANCHRGAVSANTDMDLRYATNFIATNLCETALTAVDGLPNLPRITPGDPSMSALSLRLRTSSNLRQPPVGSLRADVVGAAVVDQWIATELPDDACN